MQAVTKSGSAYSLSDSGHRQRTDDRAYGDGAVRGARPADRHLHPRGIEEDRLARSPGRKRSKSGPVRLPLRRVLRLMRQAGNAKR